MIAHKMKPRWIEPEEYLRLEESATEKSEYFNIEYHQKTAAGWLLKEVIGLDATLKLVTLELDLPLGELYEGVDWLPA